MEASYPARRVIVNGEIQAIIETIIVIPGDCLYDAAE